MGVLTAALVGGGLLAGGIAGGIIAGGSAADAAQSAADAQLKAALEGLQFQKETQAKALQYAQASPQELASIQSILNLQEQTIQKGEQALEADKELLASVDPALKEAGVQALQLLKGQEAASVGVARTSRELQRQRLQETLKNRLGAGYETSTAGAQALAAFDQQTTEVLQNAQDQTLGRLLGISAQVRPDLAGKAAGLYTAAANIGSIGLSGLQNIQARQVNAITGNKVDYGDLIANAGAPYVGDYYKNQNLGNIFGGLAGIGGGVLGKAAAGKFGGSGGTNPVPGNQAGEPYNQDWYKGLA